MLFRSILKDLAAIRSKLFTLNGLKGSRAWFDFPVLAWLGNCLDGGLLASVAATFKLSMEFEALRWEGDFLTMPLPAVFDAAQLSDLSAFILPRQPSEANVDTCRGSTKWRAGPFPAGKGVVCAVFDPSPLTVTPIETMRANLIAEAARLIGEPPHANVYSIAMVELHWQPSLNFGSSWAILSSALAGKTRVPNKS